MAEIIVEFGYWSYGEFSKTAMISRPQVVPSDVVAMTRRYAVKVDAREEAPLHFSFAGMPGRYRKTIIRVRGERADEVRSCVRDIILRYGRPDEVPFALGTSRRAGRAILDSLLREYPGR